METSAVVYNSAMFTVENSFDSVADAEAAMANMSAPSVGTLIAISRDEYANEFQLHRDRCAAAEERRREQRSDVVENRMNPLQRYRSYQEQLALPTFDTGEEADGTIGRFLIRRPLGYFIVCRGYIGQVRGEDPAWTFGEDWSFTVCDMYGAQQQAALTIGMELIGGAE